MASIKEETGGKEDEEKASKKSEVSSVVKFLQKECIYS